jgi:hypothetical protein
MDKCILNAVNGGVFSSSFVCIYNSIPMLIKHVMEGRYPFGYHEKEMKYCI